MTFALDHRRPQAHGQSILTDSSAVAILVVDDNSAKRLALKAVLSPLGYEVVEADSGVAALRRLMVQDFAVILLDVQMPIMDGFETAGLIRQRARNEMTPIIFVTAYGSDEIDRYAQGAVDFICAPVIPTELRAKVSVFANLFIKANGLATQTRELLAAAEQLSLVADAAPIGIFQTDAQNRYIYTNPRWTEITGISSHEAVGLDWDTLVGSEQRVGLVAESSGDESDPAELRHRFEIRVPGCAMRIVLVTSRPVLNSTGERAGWVGTVADVTAEAGAEAAMSEARDKADEASQLKSDFLANMSHEIRTPMNGVIGMTDLLLETGLDARQRDYAQTVRNSGEALLTIVNDILDFSQVEAGKLQIDDIEFDVRTVVDDVVSLLAGSAQSKGLEFAAVIEQAVPAVVSGDPGRVRQVLTNLIGNSIKFTHAGEIVVRVSRAESAGADSILRFEVTDTGDGVMPDKLATIFQPFVQADTSTSRKYGGTGLGLAISSHLVGLMGGTCGVSSQLGAGSTFWFTIRLHAGHEQAASRQLAPEAGLAGFSALIVDDNAGQRGVLSEYLTEWGMTVSTADSGPAALTMMRTALSHGEPFAIALVDQSMPVMDGLELLKAIVGDPDLTAAVVLLTELNQEAHVGSAVASGRCAAVSKPIRREVLQNCLLDALSQRVPEAAVDPITPAGPSGSGTPKTGRLLLAEDDLVNQKVAFGILSGAGYHVDSVLNGAEAVQAVRARSYDAILMDCQMPELNGYEATAAIRAHEGSARHTPIIAMTAGARQEDRETCLAEGMDSYLSKPVSKEVLLGLVARSLKRGTSIPRGCPDPRGTSEAILTG